MNLQNQITKIENIQRKLDELQHHIQCHDHLIELIAQISTASTEQLWKVEAKINQLEAKNNPKPKLSIEKIPPISFLSK